MNLDALIAGLERIGLDPAQVLADSQWTDDRLEILRVNRALSECDANEIMQLLREH